MQISPLIGLKRHAWDAFSVVFLVFSAHISGAEFQYPDYSWKELCGMMANLVADSGCNKGQLYSIVEAFCRDFRQHDEASTKEKTARPNVARLPVAFPEGKGVWG